MNEEATPINAAIEFALATALLCAVVTIVRWTFAGPAASELGSLRAKLAVVGLVVAILMTALILSPWGRRSGAHLNPAVTLALWLMGAFPRRAVLPYITAQLAGSVAGTGLGRLLWGTASAQPPVSFAVVAPAPSWSWPQVAITEAGTVMIVILIVGYILSHHQTRVRTILPYVVPALVGTIIVVLGPLSGGSANPARQLGPALWSGNSTYLSVYLLAPMVGAAIAALTHRALLI